MKEGKITQGVYERVLDRLTHREKLADIASRIINAGEANTYHLIREQDVRGICPNTPTQGGTGNLI